ncbi:MAG: ribosome maturation factor RimP [Oscillospiraceae bacterium]|nr:ribosome maturation factor RimP [Oscillospiraceae bacterium]
MSKNKNNSNSKKTQSRKQIEQTVRNLVGAEIINLGYEIWDIEYYNDKIEWLLDITIENPSGTPISISDCEKVTHAVSPIIDAADPIENSYSLAVSSPGLNRELKNDLHLSKYIEKEVTVKLFTKNEIAGDKNFNAILKEFSKESFKFEKISEDENIIINLAKKEIAHIYAYDEINI